MSIHPRHATASSPKTFTLERLQIVAIAVAVFILPLLMWPSLTDYNYAKCIVSLILISVLLVLWGLTIWHRPTWTIHVPWLLIPVAGFILTGVLSTIQATNPRVAIQSLLLLIYFVLLLWMIANVVRDDRDVRWILAAALLSASLAALYGVLQYYGIVPGAGEGTGIDAILSTMGNRNHLGGFLCYLFFPSIILLVRARTRWVKALSFVAGASLFSVMLLVEQTATRIAFALVTAALAIGWIIFRPAKPLRTNRWWLLGLAGVILAMSTFTILQTPPRSPGEMWVNNSGTTRTWLSLIGMEMIADHPITGVGAGNYKIDFFPYKARFAATERGQEFDFYIHPVSQAHNEVVQTGAELGILGLFMLLCVLGVLAISLWIRLGRSNEDDRLDLLLLTGGIMAFLSHSVVSFPAHVASSSLLLVVFCGLVLAPRYGEAMTSRWNLSGWHGRAIHIGIIIMGIIISVLSINDLRSNWLMERGLDQIQAGFYASGEGLLQKSLSLDFAPRQTHYYLALAQIKLGKFDAAEQSLEKCMLSFSNERVYLTYADLKLKRRELEDAQAAVEALLATPLSSDVEVQTRYIEAVICVEHRQFDQALQLLQSLSSDYPTFDPGLVALGQLYAAQGMTYSARKNYEMALQSIVKKLGMATSDLESAPPTEIQLLQEEIKTLIEQRDHVLSQIDSLP